MATSIFNCIERTRFAGSLCLFGMTSSRVGRSESIFKAMKTKRRRPKRLFKDSWRPEDKALESAEEEALERDYGEEIARIGRRDISTLRL